jgi:hypothetical protein
VKVSVATPVVVRKTHRIKETVSSSEPASAIRLRPKDAVEGFAILLNKGQVQALPNDVYVVGEEHLCLLDEAGIRYDLVSE